MIKISKNANKNYLAKVVKLKNLRKHSNADRLQCVDIDFQNVITGLDAKEGDFYVFFPLESSINKDFLSYTNSFIDKELNRNPEKAGFFEKNGRVRAMTLRGEKSMGYIVPVQEVIDWGGTFDVVDGEEFDTINGLKMCEKYVVKTKVKGSQSKVGQKPKVTRLVDGQVHLHVSTEQLRKNIQKVNPFDIISVTYKTHGTSWWVANVLNRRKLTWLEKLGQKLGINVQDKEYDLIYGSRKVVKNAALEDAKNKDHFFGYDLWEEVKDEVGHVIPKGFTLYGEYVGYDANGRAVQDGYDYGCVPPQHKLQVYRITITNVDGLVTELSYPQIVEFCEKVGLEPAFEFYHGKACGLFEDIEVDGNWHANFIHALEEAYNEKDCFMCVNKVPEEGVVVRKDSLFSFDAFKLKSFRFLNMETEKLDKGVEDIEENN